MHFPNAFKKVFIAAVDAGAIDLATTGKTQDLTPGQVGLFDAQTYSALAAAPASNKTFILAQGSYHTTDKIGPFHGGYQESVKSKVINPKYVSRFFKVNANLPLSQILVLNPDAIFRCGTTYNLRIDVKGSPALRFLNHNLYHTFDAFTGCCANDCSVSCTGDPVDPSIVMLEWATQINEDPIMSNFIKATPLLGGVTQASTGSSGSNTITLSAANANVVVGQVVSGTGVAPGAKIVAKPTSTTITVDKANVGAVSGTLSFKTVITDSYTPVVYDGTNEATIEAIDASLQIEVAYVDTKFGDCTFTVRDNYDLEPLFVYLSVTDETGDPCAIWPKANSATGAGVTEIQAPQQATGVGETVLRDFILSNRYLQDPFPDGGSVTSLRLREVLDDTALGAVSRSAFYDQVCILHNVPRLNNSTGIFDNDQYLLVIHVPTGTDVSDLTDLIQDILDQAGNGVVLETF